MFQVLLLAPTTDECQKLIPLLLFQTPPGSLAQTKMYTMSWLPISHTFFMIVHDKLLPGPKAASLLPTRVDFISYRRRMQEQNADCFFSFQINGETGY